VFAEAGLVFITEIYAAGEPRVDGLSGRAVYEGVLRRGHPAVHFVAGDKTLAESILDHLAAGDLVLTLGAGDIWKTGEDLLKRLAGAPAGPKGVRP